MSKKQISNALYSDELLASVMNEPTEQIAEVREVVSRETVKAIEDFRLHMPMPGQPHTMCMLVYKKDTVISDPYVISHIKAANKPVVTL